jgi:hypothetical protein
MTLEQGDAKVRFQLANPAAHRGLRLEQLIRGSGEVLVTERSLKRLKRGKRRERSPKISHAKTKDLGGKNADLAAHFQAYSHLNART